MTPVADETIIVETHPCPDCGGVMTKTHTNDPLKDDAVKYKCNDCGNDHIVYS